VKLTLTELRAANPAVQLDPAERFTLRQIFENTRVILAAILARHANDAALRRAIAAFWTRLLTRHGKSTFFGAVAQRRPASAGRSKVRYASSDSPVDAIHFLAPNPTTFAPLARWRPARLREEDELTPPERRGARRSPTCLRGSLRWL